MFPSIASILNIFDELLIVWFGLDDCTGAADDITDDEDGGGGGGAGGGIPPTVGGDFDCVSGGDTRTGLRDLDLDARVVEDARD